MEDAEVMEGVVVTSGVMLDGEDGDLPAVLGVGWTADIWLVGPCAWGPTVGVELAAELVGVELTMELMGVCSEELRVLEELLVLAAATAAVWLLVVSIVVVLAAVPGGVLVLGTCAWGMLTEGSPGTSMDGVCR